MAQRFLRSHKGDLHFITFCCYQCRRFLATAPARNIALQVLREVRSRYDFALIGYVFMPDHVHLLVSEPTAVPTATVMQVFKQRVSRRMRGRKRRPSARLRLRFDDAEDQQRRFWQRRYFDFNVFFQKKVIEKLHYMHANPVKEKLVHHPGDWPWGSWCHYYGRHALLVMDARERSTRRIAQLKRETLYQGKEGAHPLQRTQRVGHPPSHASM